MNCQRDKSEKGSRELYTSGSNYSSTERAKVRIVRLVPTSEATAHSVIAQIAGLRSGLARNGR